jgi:hypothetical protein
MMLSQLAPHRLAAQPEPRRSLRLPDAPEAGEGGYDDGDGMKEVISLQVRGDRAAASRRCEWRAAARHATPRERPGFTKTTRVYPMANHTSQTVNRTKTVNRPETTPVTYHNGAQQDMAAVGGEEETQEEEDSSAAAYGDSGTNSRFLELRCVLAVVRHGDRTPKQKMKMPVAQVGGCRLSLPRRLCGLRCMWAVDLTTDARVGASAAAERAANA